MSIQRDFIISEFLKLTVEELNKEIVVKLILSDTHQDIITKYNRLKMIDIPNNCRLTTIKLSRKQWTWLNRNTAELLYEVEQEDYYMLYISSQPDDMEISYGLMSLNDYASLGRKVEVMVLKIDKEMSIMLTGEEMDMLAQNMDSINSFIAKEWKNFVQ
jgi:hypothetical protein